MAAKYDDDQVLAIIAAELNLSTGGPGDSIEANRQEAYKAYLGDKGETKEGRSSIVSTDIADAIEWILPEVMKSFTQNNEVVTFDPVGPKDIKQAELESRFVYDVLMKDNNGFLTLYTFFKDALMQKNGFVKMFYEKDNSVTFESYTGINDIELGMILAEPDVEIVEQTTSDLDGLPIHDIKVKRTKISGSIKVLPVAPENFRVYSRHNSVDLKNVRFCGDYTLKTKSELIEEGYDEDLIDSCKHTSGSENSDRYYRWGMQGEGIGFNDDDPESNLYELFECYIRLDMNNDGISELLKITTLGYDKPSVILDIEEVDQNPYISATAIIMSHKMFGLSIYDRLKEIQSAKTALWRNILDNIYLQNNQRTVVVENMVNLDDLLISRPGGVIRAKIANAVQPMPTTSLSSDVYGMMDYFDQVRAGRTGVSPEGSVSDTAMGDAVGSEGLEKLLSQKEELVGLMIRVFAETGVKPICIRIRDLLIMHKDTVDEYEFRGDWEKVQPSRWPSRSRTTIRVGTGSGNRKEQASALANILTFQEKIMANPGQSLVKEDNVFAALNDFVKASGMPGAAPYFLDPASPEGQEHKQQVDASSQKQQEAELKERQMLADTQEKIANAEQGKAQAAMMAVQVRAENERLKNELANKQSEYDLHIQQLEQQLEEAKLGQKYEQQDSELQYKYYSADLQAQIAREQMALNSKKDVDNEQQS